MKYVPIKALADDDDGFRVLDSLSRSGVLPKTVFHRLPRSVRWFVRRLELRLWSFLNNLRLTDGPVMSGDICVALLRNYSVLCRPVLDEFRSQGGKVVWVLSHYHLAIESIECIPSVDIIALDVPDPIYLDSLNNRLAFFSPLNIESRFQVLADSLGRKEECIFCTGTVHLYKKKISGFVNVGGIYTLHPGRASVVRSDSSSYVKNFSVLTDDDSLYVAQRKYMAQDLVAEFNRYRFVYCGAEASGVPALGALEAMACGCEVFVEQKVAEMLKLIDGVNCWVISDDASDLLAKHAQVLRDGFRLNPSDIAEYVAWYRSQSSKDLLKNKVLAPSLIYIRKVNDGKI
jgi:hypothetical protein